jgi:hypothetical protein
LIRAGASPGVPAHIPDREREMSLLVLCPSKGRPAAASEAYATFTQTRGLPDTSLVFVLNEDEDVREYHVPYVTVPRREWMNEVLQAAVDRLLEEEAPSILGFIGDDNRFRTPGWDQRVTEVLARGGFAYCNDLARNDIPTHVFVTTPIVRALGYFGLRKARHLYIDNAWAVLGSGAGCLSYIPDVVVEHLHPFFGKGTMDDSYRASNSQEMYSHDRAVFESWLEHYAEGDIEKVRSALG